MPWHDPGAKSCLISKTLRRFLSNTPAYLLACLILLCIVGGCAYFLRADLANVLGASRERANVWQQWAGHYSGLFGMLPYPARVGIQQDGERASGILIEKTATGFRAEQKTVLSREHPGLVFILDNAARERLLANFKSRNPDDIWQMMKDDLYADHIKIWYDPDIEALKRGGYLRLMRDIDTRPDGYGWADVKAKLGEPVGAKDRSLRPK